VRSPNPVGPPRGPSPRARAAIIAEEQPRRPTEQADLDTPHHHRQNTAITTDIWLHNITVIATDVCYYCNMIYCNYFSQ
jgi:hypothetical protein